jgi:hypothetical protein
VFWFFWKVKRIQVLRVREEKDKGWFRVVCHVELVLAMAVKRLSGVAIDADASFDLDLWVDPDEGCILEHAYVDPE